MGLEDLESWFFKNSNNYATLIYTPLTFTSCIIPYTILYNIYTITLSVYAKIWVVQGKRKEGSKEASKHARKKARKCVHTGLVRGPQ